MRGYAPHLARLKNAWTAFFNGLLDQAQTNGLVDSADQIIVRNNTTSLANQLKFLVVGPGGPFAPESSAGGDGGGDKMDDGVDEKLLDLLVSAADSGVLPRHLGVEARFTNAKGVQHVSPGQRPVVRMSEGTR